MSDTLETLVLYLPIIHQIRNGINIVVSIIACPTYHHHQMPETMEMES